MMLAHNRNFIIVLLGFMLFSCADDYPYLSDHIRRATDAIMTPCDPYDKGAFHTCVVYASAFSQKLLVYDASAEELVLSPMAYWPLYIKVGTLTNKLASVTSNDKKFPYFLALDHGLSAIFAIRAFPSEDNKHKSFTTPKAQNLPKNPHKPFQIAAWQGADHVFALITYREDKSVMVVALDKNTGLMLPHIPPKNISVGVKPSHVVISADAQVAIISDEASNDIYEIDLTTIPQFMTGNPEPAITEIKVGASTDRIYLSTRDFGLGQKNYVAALKAEGSELMLINVSGPKKVEASVKLKIHPKAAYFPDAKSEPCCQGQASWLAVADLKGQLYYYAIKNSQGQLSLQEAQAIDLTSEKNLALSQLQLIKIIGGHVEVDSSLKREVTCPDNRKMFYVASFGSDRPKYWSSADSKEVEAQGYSCEGKDDPTRFGYKRE